MDIEFRLIAATAVIGLALMTVLGMDVGRALDVSHRDPTQSMGAPATSTHRSRTAMSRGSAMDGGAGLETGMPYYSFAARSTRL